MIEISLKDVVGGGYKDYWNFKGRYRVCKGGRGSKKSVTTAINFIERIMEYPLANALIVRKVFKDHKDSTYAQLKWAINRLHVEAYWQASLSPLELRYKPTGQKIMFRGMDKPMSVTSITVETGFLCWAWFEEAYQVEDEDAFNKVDMSIRGNLPPGYFKQITLTFNPWNEKHWLKRRFFDVPDSDVMAKTTDYRCNEFLGQDDIDLFEKMKVKDPRRYKIEGLGEWGIAEGAIYDNYEEQEFDPAEVTRRLGIKSAFGLDFGYTNDPTAFIAMLVDLRAETIYVFDEFYEQGMVNKDIADRIKYKGYAKEKIVADAAEPKSIEEIRRFGIHRIKEAQKGKDSILNGIQKIQGYHLIVHPKCTNVLTELGNYVWDKDKSNGKAINKPVDEYNHLMDAMRYAMEDIRNVASPLDRYKKLYGRR
jgi:phage terminase large subunit